MARKLPVNLKDVRSSIPLTQEEILNLEIAAFHEFRIPVTAFLTSVYFSDGICIGVVWGHDRADATGRFADGHKIHTSHVMRIERNEDFRVIVTRNSRYVMVSLYAELVPSGTSVH